MVALQEPYFIVSNECSFVDVQLLKMQELPEDVRSLESSADISPSYLSSQLAS